MFRIATKFRPETDAFERARAAGFRGAEFWLSQEVLSDWRNVLADANCFPLYYALHFPNELDVDNTALQQVVGIYRELECRALVIHQQQFDLYGHQIRTLCPGVQLAVENHVLDRAGFDAWTHQSPSLALDVEHLWKHTLDTASLREVMNFLRAFLKRHVERLCHVHLSGYRPGGAEHLPLHHNVEMVTEVFSALADSGFTGFVVSESDAQYQREADLKRDVALYRDWFDHNSVLCPPAWITALPHPGQGQIVLPATGIQPASSLHRTGLASGDRSRKNQDTPPTTIPG